MLQSDFYESQYRWESARLFYEGWDDSNCDSEHIQSFLHLYLFEISVFYAFLKIYP